MRTDPATDVRAPVPPHILTWELTQVPAATISKGQPITALLDRFTKEGKLYLRLPDGAVRCQSCGHRCLIREGRRGICRLRYNRGGALYVPSGYVAGCNIDPIEKKPFFHVYPGALALSFGMVGCNLHCTFCQNYISSQALREEFPYRGIEPTTAEQLVAPASRMGARIVTATYNEPLITSEWAVEVFREARRQGLTTSFVSNGHATPEVIDFLRPWVDLYKVDLKSFRQEQYRRLGGVLSHVLSTIGLLFDRGFWVEVVTLVVPGFNDSDAELRDIARFLAGVSRDIPWHVTAFHGEYRMSEVCNTPASSLIRAAAIGRGEGLRFVYAGNMPGAAGGLENTFCPDCNSLLVERSGYRIVRYRLEEGGKCPGCGAMIPGRWD